MFSAFASSSLQGYVDRCGERTHPKMPHLVDHDQRFTNDSFPKSGRKTDPEPFSKFQSNPPTAVPQTVKAVAVIATATASPRYPDQCETAENRWYPNLPESSATFFSPQNFSTSLFPSTHQVPYQPNSNFSFCLPKIVSLPHLPLFFVVARASHVARHMSKLPLFTSI